MVLGPKPVEVDALSVERPPPNPRTPDEPTDHPPQDIYARLSNVWISSLIPKGGHRPKLNIGLPNSRTVAALIDTGADVSVISEQLFKGLDVIITKIPSVSLKSATGDRVRVLGEANIVISVGGRQVETKFLVVSGIKTDCILGVDFLHSNRVVMDSGTKRFFWPDKAGVARAAKAIIVPPRTERKVKLIVQGVTKSTTQNATWLFEPSVKYAREGIVDDPAEGPTIVVSNVTDFEMEILTTEVLGTVNQCEILELSELEKLAKPKMPKQPPFDLTKIDLSNIPSSMRAEYETLLTSYRDVFSTHSYDVGSTGVLPQHITLKDPSKIACTPPYRIPEHLRPVAQDFISNLASAGVIQKSASPFSSPLMLVRKNDAKPDQPLVDQYRVVHDYRRLNDNIVRDSYPMRNLHELLDSVSQGKIWSVIDLSSGFWNQVLTKPSRAYTAFGLPGSGHWEYTRSAQGLTNSPATFQRLLDHVLQDLEGVYVYIDDVIICSQNQAEHLKRLRSVFERFRKYHLKCKPSKLQLGAAQVNYLGFNLSRANGIRAGAAKIEVVRGWKPPTTITEIKQFLGLCSFFRRTIPRFAEVAAPLTTLTRQAEQWQGPTLTDTALAAFNQLKEALCSRPCLQPVDFGREFILTTDASQVGLGAILSQLGQDGEEHPCAYASRVLSPAEQKWAPTHLEHLGMVWACRHFRPYLAGKHFLLRTDHKPLVSLNRIQGQALERLRAELDDFRPFTVQYIKGDKMPADGLSRSKIDGIEARQLPPLLTHDQLYSLQRSDNKIKSLVVWLKWQQEPRDPVLLSFLKVMQGKVELHRGVVVLKETQKQVALAPTEFIPTILYHGHDSPLAGHRSFRQTLGKIRESWYWPSMAQDVEAHCRGCRVCQTVNLPAHGRPSPMGKLPPVSRFNERVHLDLLGPLPRCQGKVYLLVVQDAHTKWVELIPLGAKTAEETAEQLVNFWVSRHGKMELLVSDQGKEFVNSTMIELCRRLRIGHQTTSAMHPQANGLVERTNRTILAFLRKYLAGSNEWVPQLHPMQFSYNTAVHASTGRSPYLLLYGRRPNVPLALLSPDDHPRYSERSISQQLRFQAQLQQEVLQSEEAAWKQQKETFDKRSRLKQIKVADIVYLSRPHQGGQFQKFQPLFMGPYTVVELLGENNVRLVREDGKSYKTHKNRVKLAPFVQQLFNGTQVADPVLAQNQPPPVAQPLPIDDLDDGAMPDLQGPRRRRRHASPAAPEPVTIDDEFVPGPPDEPEPAVPITTPPRGARPDPPAPRGNLRRMLDRFSPARRTPSAPTPSLMTRARARAAGIKIPGLFPHGLVERQERETLENESSSSSQNDDE